jgi:hypothetical protein
MHTLATIALMLTLVACTGNKAANPIDLPAECEAYKLMIEKLGGCDQMRESSRAALSNGYNAISRSWSNGSLTDQSKQVIADRCKQAMDATKQAGAMCAL